MWFFKNKNKNCGLTEAKHEWQGGGGSPAAVLKLGLVQLLGFAQRLHSTASPLPFPALPTVASLTVPAQNVSKLGVPKLSKVCLSLYVCVCMSALASTRPATQTQPM